ncbi:MAG: branched-chain amino acid transaminase [candidate division Zixibacteria bacterium]|nr:branched-chain amino acid transaminase [candidate division Zixibacteria bacterium]MBU1470365.1 branched-chain amino acid transaminase [candidate division Zixibacteria bacterium]MBU2624907.1 branched-chain amino acid transaminase [candidate division Zixibacteria bacterium]
MAFKGEGKIWMNGEFVDWNDAKIHVLSHVVHYGSSIFEGIRAYKTNRGTAVFRLGAHIDRLFDSAKIYRMDIPFSNKQLFDASIETIRVNNLEACYIRPVVYRGYHSLGVDPRPCPVDVSIAVWEWGKYLGPEALENGVEVCVSSWARIAPNTLPAMAKCGANYMNSQLIKTEAIARGCVEGIALDSKGNVSEGSGENIFIVRDGVVITPPFDASILPGITRNTVITLATELGYKVIEGNIPREALYIAEEVFFTGSAAEITPISMIDKITIGDGKRGPITKRLQDRFFEYLSGDFPDTYGWLDFVYAEEKVEA